MRLALLKLLIALACFVACAVLLVWVSYGV